MKARPDMAGEAVITVIGYVDRTNCGFLAARCRVMVAPAVALAGESGPGRGSFVPLSARCSDGGG